MMNSPTVSIIDTFRDAVFGVDQKGKIIFANREASRLLGYSYKEFIGKAIEILVPSARRSQHVSQRSEYISHPRVRPMGSGLEINALRKDGAYIPVDVTLSYIKSETGVQVIAFMRDVTERRRTADALASRERYLALLNDMTHTILISNELEPTLQTLAFNMRDLIGADDCCITQWNEEKKTLISVTSTGLTYGEKPQDKPNTTEFSITAKVLQSGSTIVVSDVEKISHGCVGTTANHTVHSIIGVPLTVGAHQLGAALLAFLDHHQFTEEEISKTEQAGNLVALAIWNFQQEADIQKKLKESTALARISQALSASERIGLGEVLQLIVDSALELMPHAQKSVIHLLEAENRKLIPRAVSGFDNQENESRQIQMSPGEGVAGRVIQDGITINIGDILTNPQFLLSYTSPTFRSLLVAPVQSGGQQIGTISLQSSMINVFSGEDAELLHALAVQAAIAIDNTKLIEDIQQRLHVENALYQISRQLASILDPSEMLKQVVNLLIDHFGYSLAQIFLLDESNGDLVLQESSDRTGSCSPAKEDCLTKDTVRRAAKSGIPVLNQNPDAGKFSHETDSPVIASEIAVPMKMEEKVVGVLNVQQASPQRLTDDDLHLINAISDQLSVALQKANLYVSLQTALEHEKAIRSKLVQSERLALVGRLLASVSHELNNPLQAIQTALYLFKDDEQLTRNGRENLELLIKEADRMADLIRRLRSTYRPIRSTDFQSVQVNRKIEDVSLLTATLMRHKEIEFKFFKDENLPTILAIPDQIRQVVLNLFINAIEAMNTGGTLTVETQYLPKQKKVLLTVKDTGPGIDPDILPHIFEAFITGKNTGTGLGLTITHDIVHHHHGHMEAENNTHGGAIFKVWFPVEEGDSL